MMVPYAEKENIKKLKQACMTKSTQMKHCGINAELQKFKTKGKESIEKVLRQIHMLNGYDPKMESELTVE